MPTIELAVKVDGVEQAVAEIPTRYGKTILQAADKWDGTTATERAEALLGYVCTMSQIKPEAHRKIGHRYYDAMVNAVNASIQAAARQAARDAADDDADDHVVRALENAAAAAAPIWQRSRVEIDGMAALEAAYDAL